MHCLPTRSPLTQQHLVQYWRVLNPFRLPQWALRSAGSSLAFSWVSNQTCITSGHSLCYPDRLSMGWACGNLSFVSPLVPVVKRGGWDIASAVWCQDHPGPVPRLRQRTKMAPETPKGQCLTLLTGGLLLQQQHHRGTEGAVDVPGARLGPVVAKGSVGCDSQLLWWQWWCAAPCKARQLQLLHTHSPEQGSGIPQHAMFWDYTSVLTLQAGAGGRMLCCIGVPLGLVALAKE